LVKQEEESKAEEIKKGKKQSTLHKDEVIREEEFGAKSRINMFGFMGDEELAEIFKHKSDHSGSESVHKIRFGKRGKRVTTSEFYPGVRLGLGIHHHDIDSAMRDAVESGLRLGHLRVVLCDHSMGLGLNMPVKTVVFLGGNGQQLKPEDFVQVIFLKIVVSQEIEFNFFFSLLFLKTKFRHLEEPEDGVKMRPEMSFSMDYLGIKSAGFGNLFRHQK